MHTIELLIYLADVLENVQQLLAGVTFFGFVYIILHFAISNDPLCGSHEIPFSKWIPILTICSAMCLTLIPTKGTIYLLIGTELSQSQLIKTEYGGKIKIIVDKQFEEIIANDD